MYVLVHDESEPSASLQNAADLLRQMKVPQSPITLYLPGVAASRSITLYPTKRV